MFYKSELGHDDMEAAKKIYCMKGEGTIDHSTATRWFKKFHSGRENLKNQTRPSRA